jgi:HSP20 family molecular chaperone IbpA
MADDSEEKFFESLAGGVRRSVPKSDEEYTEEIEMPVTHKKVPSKKTGKVEVEKNASDENDTEEQLLDSNIDFESEPEGQLTIDVYQTPNDIVVESAIAGVKPDDIDITVTNDSVSVRGHRRRDIKIKDEDYFYQECYWGRFSRSIILPQEIDADKATVTFKNGVLTIKLPKLNKQRAKKLKVKFE